MKLTRAETRMLEVWALMRPYGAVDWDEIAEQAHSARKAVKQRWYLDMRLFDPGAYKRMVEQQREKREASRKWRKLRPAERREMLRMHAAGASSQSIARAFGVALRTAVGVISEQTPGVRRRGEKIRAARSSANARWKSTPELVSKVLGMDGSNRAVARALGLSHSLVGRLRANKSCLIQSVGA